MNQRTLYQTKFVQYAGILDSMKKSVKYLALNQEVTIPAAQLLEMMGSIRTIINTPTAEITNRLLHHTSLSSFIGIDIRKNMNVPEIIATAGVVLDTKCLEPNILSSMPALQDKVILNLTGLVTRTEMGYNAKAVDAIQSQIVRGQLVMAYHDDNSCFSSYIGEYAVKCYSMIISNMISRRYNLDAIETLKVAAILSIYYGQLFMDPNKGNLDVPPMYMRNKELGNERMRRDYAEMFYEDTYKGMDLDGLIATIKKHGPERLESFNIGVFKSLIGSLGPDAISSAIAAEYPPYWIWLLIVALSGTKIGLGYQLSSNKLLPDGKGKFLQQIYGCEQLFTAR